MCRAFSWLGITAGLLLLLGAGAVAGCSNSKPWATCGQECGSPCWPGPRIGCPEACLLAPCPPEPWCPEKKKPKCRPAPRVCATPATAPVAPPPAAAPALDAPASAPGSAGAPAAPDAPAPAMAVPAVEGAPPAAELPPPPAGAVPPVPGMPAR
jgi:hypothetical protein